MARRNPSDGTNLLIALLVAGGLYVYLSRRQTQVSPTPALLPLPAVNASPYSSLGSGTVSQSPSSGTGTSLWQPSGNPGISTAPAPPSACANPGAVYDRAMNDIGYAEFGTPQGGAYFNNVIGLPPDVASGIAAAVANHWQQTHQVMSRNQFAATLASLCR